jgi:galactokinase
MINALELKRMFENEYGYEASNLLCFYTPGRVNLIGEHIDYNGGMVFPAALSIGIYGMLSERQDKIIRLRSLKGNGEIIVDLEKDIINDKKDGWGNYPKGIIKYVMNEGTIIKGCDILYYSDLPDASGLSSSAALEVITGYMMKYVAGEIIDKVKLAVMCQAVENKFIGVNCGIMDQFSVANGKKDNAILLDCSTLKYEYVPFILQDHSLVIINTNAKRGLADSKYNERRGECEKALEIIKTKKAINDLCQAEIDDVENMLKDEIIAKRAKHVVTENERVHGAVNALKKGDLNGFGKLMTASHNSLRYDYEVTGKELDSAVEEALKVKGCIGARMTGAGFGGCAIALVENDSIDEFKKKVAAGYTKATGLTPSFYVSIIEDGAKVLQ